MGTFKFFIFENESNAPNVWAPKPEQKWTDQRKMKVTGKFFELMQENCVEFFSKKRKRYILLTRELLVPSMGVEFFSRVST